MADDAQKTAPSRTEKLHRDELPARTEPPRAGSAEPEPASDGAWA